MFIIYCIFGVILWCLLGVVVLASIDKDLKILTWIKSGPLPIEIIVIMWSIVLYLWLRKL